MKISVAMIALNEADYIIQALDSIRPVVDELVVIDGGSTDGTAELVEEWAQRHSRIDVKLGVCQWENHFGDQRQVSFHACTGDWVMRVDCDETASKAVRQQLRRTLESLPARCMAVRVRQLNLYPNEEHYAADCGGWETWPRIFRRMDELQWMGQVHEHVMLRHGDKLDEIPEQQIWNWNANMIHHGWLERGRREAREELYMSIPGSGFDKAGALTERKYVIRRVPEVI